MITAICQECGKQFEYELKPGYPRKYCDECSTKKKAEYNSRQKGLTITPEVPVIKMGIASPIQTAKHDIVIQRTEKPNSFEFGVASMRHKIYYNDISELKERVKELQDEGLSDPAFFIEKTMPTQTFRE